MRFAADTTPQGSGSSNRSSEDVYTLVPERFILSTSRVNGFPSFHFRPEIFSARFNAWQPVCIRAVYKRGENYWNYCRISRELSKILLYDIFKIFYEEIKILIWIDRFYEINSYFKFLIRYIHIYEVRLIEKKICEYWNMLRKTSRSTITL